MGGKHVPAGKKRIDGARRHSCRPEQVMQLLRRAQTGDVLAEHELHRVFAPLVQGVLAKYRSDPGIAEDLPGEGYLILHRLLLQFDASRGVNLFTYLQRTLPQDVWSRAGRQRAAARRETLLGCLTNPESGREGAPAEPELAFRQVIWQEGGWLEQQSSIEQSIILRLDLEAALKALPQRQREVFELWQSGYSHAETAGASSTSPAACRQALKRAFEGLREALRRSV
jgi:RNA polymerase sigma factor (sigma-70 family)